MILENSRVNYCIDNCVHCSVAARTASTPSNWRGSTLSMPRIHIYILLLQLQPFYGSLDFVRNNLCELVPEETFTHSHLPIMDINHPLSASAIFYDTWHPPCSIYMPDSLFPQSPSFLWFTSWPGTLHFWIETSRW